MLECKKICKVWEKHKLITVNTVQEEFDEVQLKSGAKGILSFIAQAQDWESQGEYVRAIQCYLKVKDSEKADTNVIVDALKRVCFY